jgi:hypothetical protein
VKKLLLTFLLLFPTLASAEQLQYSPSSGGGGAAQTPWTSDIDADEFNLDNVGTVQTNNLESGGSTIEVLSNLDLDTRTINSQQFNGGHFVGDGSQLTGINCTSVNGLPIDCNGNFIDNLNSHGQVITDPNGFTSIDPNSRLLQTGFNTTPMDYSGNIDSGAAISFDSSNNTSIANNIVDFSDITSISPINRTLSDSSGVQSLDYGERFLWNSGQTLVSIDYSGTPDTFAIMSFDTSNNTYNVKNIPTSCSGLPTGDIANVAGILNICP